MQIGRITGATRVLGKSQGYLGLPLRDEIITCTVNGDSTPCMVTAWLPTAEEIAAIAAGAPIHVRIIGTTHPPIHVEVAEAPDALAPRRAGRRREMTDEVEVVVEMAGHMNVNGEDRLGAFITFPSGPPPWPSMLIWEGERLTLSRNPQRGMSEYGPYVAPTTGRARKP